MAVTNKASMPGGESEVVRADLGGEQEPCKVDEQSGPRTRNDRQHAV